MNYRELMSIPLQEVSAYERCLQYVILESLNDDFIDIEASKQQAEYLTTLIR